MEEAMESMMGMAVFFLIYGLIASVFSIVCYVFKSLGTYTIAKRRGIHSPWLSWIPIGTEWIWGCIGDQYQYVAKGKVKNRRKVILVLDILALIGSAVVIGMYINVLVGIISTPDLEHISEEAVMELLMPLLSMGGVAMLLSVVSIVLLVFEYIVLYDLFTSCDPKNSVMYLVLSILFSVTLPFFIFACRNRDLGMPPRKAETTGYIPPQPAWKPAEPTAEPWENKQ